MAPKEALQPIPPAGYFLTRWREIFKPDLADGRGGGGGPGMPGICEGACGAVEQSADQAKRPPEKRELGLGRSGQMPSLWRL